MTVFSVDEAFGIGPVKQPVVTPTKKKITSNTMTLEGDDTFNALPETERAKGLQLLDSGKEFHVIGDKVLAGVVTGKPQPISVDEAFGVRAPAPKPKDETTDESVGVDFNGFVDNVHTFMNKKVKNPVDAVIEPIHKILSRSYTKVTNRVLTESGVIGPESPNYDPSPKGFSSGDKDAGIDAEHNRDLTQRKEDAPNAHKFGELENPVELILNDSIPAHMLKIVNNLSEGDWKKVQSARNTANQLKIIAHPEDYPKVSVESAQAAIDARLAKASPNVRQMWTDLADAYKHDPAGLAAEFANSIMADPELIFAPVGLGMKVVGAGRIAKMAAGAARFTERANLTADSILTTGGLSGAASLADQVANGRDVSLGETGFATLTGAALGSVFGLFRKNAAFKKTIEERGTSNPNGFDEVSTKDFDEAAIEDLAREDNLIEDLINLPKEINPHLADGTEIKGAARKKLETLLGLDKLDTAGKKKFLAGRQSFIKGMTEPEKAKYFKTKSAERLARARSFSAAEAGRAEQAPEATAEQVKVASALDETQRARLSRVAAEADAAEKAHAEAPTEETATALDDSIDNLNTDEVLQAATQGDAQLDAAMKSAVGRDAKRANPRYPKGDIHRELVARLGVGSLFAGTAYALNQDPDTKAAGAFVAALTAITVPGGGNVFRRLHQAGAIAADGHIIGALVRAGEVIFPKLKPEEEAAYLSHAKEKRVSVEPTAEELASGVVHGEQHKVAAEQVKLVERIKAGDMQAFKTLHDEFGPRMFYAAKRKGLSPADAQDAVQNAWIRIYDNIGTFDPTKSALPTWLQTIAEREAIRVYAKNKADKRGGKVQVLSMDRAGLDSLDESSPVKNTIAREVDEVAADIDSPEEVALQEDAKTKLAAIINALPKTYKEPFILARVEGMGRADIAEKLGLSMENTYKTIQRADAMVQEALAKGRNSTRGIAAQKIPKNQRGSVDRELLGGVVIAGAAATAGAAMFPQDRAKGALAGVMLAGLGFGRGSRGRMGGRGFKDELGAIRLKGEGEWSKGTHDALAFHLAPEEMPGAGIDKTYFDWASKSVKTYLNKHAGTADDPLKDIVLSAAEEDMPAYTWGDSFEWTQKYSKDTALYPEFKAELKIPDGVDKTIFSGADARLGDFLTHVGDYLKLEVPKSKLPQYDLVRAVKETVAWDAANLAKAEKAQVKSMEGMPVYKSYSDGSKWVQLTRPGEFAQESDVMGHSVRGYEPQNQYLKNDTEYLSPDAHLTESQLSDIKTIVKKYTTDVDTYVQARDGEATFDYEAFLYDYPDAGNDVQTWTDKHIHSYVDNPDWIPESGSSGSAEYGVGTGGWEAIKNGSAKVYSLRDKNGRSHVTVEVDVRINDRTAIGLYEKETGKDWSDNSPGWNRPTPDYHKWIIQNADRIPKLNAITQIKGKGNAKPADRYLAQVRDFVQSGKWDDVEDLQNAGLINIRERELTKSLVQRIADLYGSDRYILTSEEFNKAQDVTWKNTPGRGPRNQQGSIDLELLLKGAAITGFAMVGYHYSDGVDKDGEPTNGKLIGALTAAGLTATALFVRGKNKSIAGEVLDHAVDAGVPISSEIRQISEPLLHHLTDHERVVYETIHQHFEKAAPFLQKFNELRFGTGTKGELNKKLGRESEGYRVLSRAILTGRAAITDKILTKLNNPELTAAWKQTRSLLDSVGDKLVALGRFKPGELEYFPRIVKDLEGLRTALNSKHRSVLDSALDAAQQKLNKKVSGTNIKARELTPLEQSLIINKVLRDQEWNSHLPGYAKDRRIDVIPDELLKHYYSPAESLHSYVRSAVKDIERAKFFGEHLKTAKSKGKLYTNLDDSIGAYVNQVLKDKDVTTDQRNRLLRILTARFGNGEKAPAKLIQMATNLSYASLLGDVMSATSQSADLVIALHTQGLVPTIEGLVRTVSRNKNIDVRAMGLADHMAEEFADTLRSSRFVNNLFKYSLFTGIDLFGKNVVLNAAVSKFGRMARTEAGQAKIRADYGKRMGTKEIDQFITDLNKGEVSDLVRTMAFTELSRTQPISKLELPLLHLDHPNTRFVYQYKTFMIKQLDLFNQDSLKLIQTGEPTKVAKGVYNFVKIGTLLGLGGAGTTYIKQYIKNVYASARGYETQNVEMKLSDIPINMFKTFALSQYSLDKITGVSKEEAERRREAEETGARQQKASPVGGLVNALAPTSIAETLDVIARHDKTALDKMPALGWLFKAERENKEAEENQ